MLLLMTHTAAARPGHASNSYSKSKGIAIPLLFIVHTEARPVWSERAHVAARAGHNVAASIRTAAVRSGDARAALLPPSPPKDWAGAVSEHARPQAVPGAAAAPHLPVLQPGRLQCWQCARCPPVPLACLLRWLRKSCTGAASKRSRPPAWLVTATAPHLPVLQPRRQRAGPRLALRRAARAAAAHAEPSPAHEP